MGHEARGALVPCMGTLNHPALGLICTSMRKQLQVALAASS